MTIEELYKEYGELMIKQEIITNKINETKKAIVACMRKPSVEEVVEEPKES